MADDFEAEVKRIKPEERPSEARKDPGAKRGKRPPPTEDDQGEASPLKTVGGTPIIERTPEG